MLFFIIFINIIIIKMISPWVLINVLNLAPGLWFLLSPLTISRNNMPGNRFGAYRPFYYRRMFHQLFFGRHVAITIPVIVGYFGLQMYRGKGLEDFYYNKALVNIVEFNHEEYDEHSSPNSKRILEQYRLSKLREKNTEMFENMRVETEYKLKSQAFDVALANYKKKNNHI